MPEADEFEFRDSTKLLLSLEQQAATGGEVTN